MDDKTNDPKCGDCPDYTRLSSDNSVGYCQAINDYQSSTHPACPPRRRELEALAERDNWKAAFVREAQAGTVGRDMHMERVYRQRDKVVRDEALAEVERLKETLAETCCPSGAECPLTPEGSEPDCRACWDKYRKKAMK